MPGQLTKNLTLSLCALIVALGAGEFLARLKYSPERLRDESLFEYDREKIYRLRGGIQRYFAGIENVTINSSGFRGPEVSLSKPDGTVRIVVLGDSVSFGHGVPDDAPYPRVLEELLNHPGAEGRYEVLNLGVPGYSAFQEYFDLGSSLNLEPDLVILQFNLNDVVEPYVYWRRFGGAGEIPTMPEILDIPYYDHLLYRHSALYLFLRDMIARVRFWDPSGTGLQEKARQREIYAVENLVLKADRPEIRSAWNEYLLWLKRMAGLAKAERIPFILLAGPHDFQLVGAPGLDSPQRILARFCAENEIAYVDLLPVLRRDLAGALVAGDSGGSPAGLTTLLAEAARQRPERIAQFWRELFLDENHPTARGHRYIAQQLSTLVSSLVSRQPGAPLTRAPRAGANRRWR